MAAAGISAAVLGYAVIWSYGGPEAPPVGMSAPPAPEPQKPMPPIASAPSDGTAQSRAEGAPNPVLAALAPPDPTQPRVETASRPVTPPVVVPPQEEPAREAALPTSSLPSTTEAILSAPYKAIEKPQVATAPKDAQTAGSPLARVVAPPKAESSVALPLPDRPQAASRSVKPSMQQAAKSEIAESAPAPRPVEKPEIARSGVASLPQLGPKSAEFPPSVSPQTEIVTQPPLPAAEPAQPPPAAKLAAVTTTPGADSSASTPPSPERVVHPRPRNFRTAPPQREQRSSIVPSTLEPSWMPPSPQLESPATVAPTAPLSNTLALAPPAEKAEPPLAVSPPVLANDPERPARTSPPRPSTTTADHPTITIIRGSRRSVTHQPVSKPRAPELPQKQKIAALPSPAGATRTATDAAPILVLRGVRGSRYALASTPQASPEPPLTVVRGGRPHPVILQPFAPPNALILHIRR